MDTNRRWALETFGKHGALIRSRIPALVNEEHVASVDAQEASGHRSTGVYGEFWRGILEKFEEFGNLPGATMVRPDGAPYKIPVINGVALFPWRYSRTLERGIDTVLFGTSDTRSSIANLRPPSLQGELDIEVPDPELTDEERELVSSFESYTKDPVVETGRLVLVAICSSTRGLFDVRWGEAQLGSSGFVTWVTEPEKLFNQAPTRPVSTMPRRTFTSGPVPEKFPTERPDEASGSNE